MLGVSARVVGELSPQRNECKSIGMREYKSVWAINFLNSEVGPTGYRAVSTGDFRSGQSFVARIDAPLGPISDDYARDAAPSPFKAADAM